MERDWEREGTLGVARFCVCGGGGVGDGGWMQGRGSDRVRYVLRY